MKRAGFTLIELLVVIAIIGVLMSLTIPAVQSAREAGRRAECANNIRQLSLACQTHNSSRNRIPGYVEYLKLKPTAAKPNPGNRRITWAVRLLPYMEESGLWEAWNDADTSTTNYLAPLKDVFTCKSNPILATEGPVNCFAANCGVNDVAAGGERHGNGMFFRGLPGESSPSFTKSLSKVPDGASNTILLSENIIQGGTWIAGVEDTLSDDEGAAKAEAMTGIVWWHPSFLTSNQPNTSANRNSMLATYPMLAVNGQKLEGPASYNATNSPRFARPASGHPGVVNVAMCGGEVLTLSETVDYLVYQQLMTSINKKGVSDMFATGDAEEADDAKRPLADNDFK